MQVKPRVGLEGLSPTVHGGQAWRLNGIEDYSQNLNPFGPPPDLLGDITKAISGVGHYPDADCTEVRDVIAKRYGLTRDNVIMGAGSSEIIRNFPFALLDQGDTVLIPKPSFAEYAQQCNLAGVNVEYIPLRGKKDFRIDIEELSGMLDAGKYRAVYICNPNNPTGCIEKREKILDIVKECEDRGIYVFLDETLLALAKDSTYTSCSTYVNDYTNLITAGSLTKSFAIPGMRIGFGLASPEIAAEMQKVRLPWNLGTIEQAVAKSLVDLHTDYVKNAASVLSKEMSLMYSELEDMGFPVGITDTFFTFASTKKLKINGAELQRMMLREGIMIRDCASFGPEFENYVRYCVKDRESNGKFLTAADKVMKSLTGH